MEPYLKTDFLRISRLCKILHLLNDMSFAGFCVLFKIVFQIYKNIQTHFSVFEHNLREQFP